MSLNADLVELFETAALVLEIKGENPFKTQAFQKVARLLEDSTEDVRARVAAGTLEQIKGVGESSRKIIEEFVTTGRSTDYDELLASIPPGLIELRAINGLGPKTISLFWKERGITGLDDLARAVDDGSLEGLKGIGAKKIEAIRQGIAIRKQAAERRGFPEALKVAEPLRDAVAAMPSVGRVEIAGSLRRRRETVGDVDLLCVIDGDDTKPVVAAFAELPGVERVLASGETKASILTAGGLQVDLRVVPSASFGAALVYFTGSKEHNKRLRSIALERGQTLNEWGLYDAAAFEASDRKPGHAPPLKSLVGPDEIDVYRDTRTRPRPAGVARGPRRDRAGDRRHAADPDRARRPARRPAHPHDGERRREQRSSRWPRRPRRSATPTSASPTIPRARPSPTASTRNACSSTPPPSAPPTSR